MRALATNILEAIAILAAGTAAAALARWLGYAADSVSVRMVFTTSIALGGITYAGTRLISRKQSLDDFLYDTCGTAIGTFAFVGLPFFALKRLSLILLSKPLFFLNCLALSLALACLLLWWLVWLEPVAGTIGKK